MPMKNSDEPPTGIEPATFRLAQHCLNQMRHRVPHTVSLFQNLLGSQKRLHYTVARYIKAWLHFYMMSHSRYKTQPLELRTQIWLSEYYNSLLINADTFWINIYFYSVRCQAKHDKKGWEFLSVRQKYLPVRKQRLEAQRDMGHA
jgi:hypothetical protein